MSNLPDKRSFEVVNINEERCKDFENFADGLASDFDIQTDEFSLDRLSYCEDCGEQEDDSLDFNDEFNGSTVEEMDKFLSEANDKLAEWLQQIDIKAKTDENVAAWANILGKAKQS